MLKCYNHFNMIKISIVFSCTNEAENPFIIESLRTIQNLGDLFETIIVTNNQNLNPYLETKLGPAFWQIILLDNNSRAARLNEGAKKAKGQLILFHHPRSYLKVEGYRTLLEQSGWGAFTHCFERRHLLLDFTSWYSNNVRGKIKEIYYLDHCLFVEKELFEKAGPIPNVEIFEDTLLCEKLNKWAPPTLLPHFAITSSIRFSKNGIIKQIVLNQILKIAFLLGANDELMNKIYEKGLNLNSHH